MEALEQIRDRIVAAVPGAAVAIVPDPGAAAQHSLLVDAAHAREVARFLRDDPALRLDYCSNATGVDWLDKTVVEATRTRAAAPDGSGERIIEHKTTRTEPGRLEVVYHLYSMELKHGPVILRLRTAGRAPGVSLPSLTPLWRSCEFQEREIFDLFGIRFDGHPDLRRILMWDEFADHPMRKDFVGPDDDEWEPTRHAAPGGKVE